MIKNYRLRELDFLRGIAILLVLVRHQPFNHFLQCMGWIGVDLFFVLSGFLVSGLLFREHIKYGKIQPGRFLIRRGFKIYPIYYLFYFVYLIPLLMSGHYDLNKIISELTFTQNYYTGFGYANPPSWSLAIEEHFYFGLSFFLWKYFKNSTVNQESNSDSVKQKVFENRLIAILFFILFLRLASNFFFPSYVAFNFTMTHLRIDSLLFGVLISYLFHFNKNKLLAIFNRNKIKLLIICVAGLIWTPFIDSIPSFFAKTFGFTMLYLSFGIILTYVLITEDINEKLNKYFNTKVVAVVSRIGYCSYSIYIIHSFVNIQIENLLKSYEITSHSFVIFVFTSVLSVLLGFFMTFSIEKYFLKIRDTYFPSREKYIAPQN